MFWFTVQRDTVHHGAGGEGMAAGARGWTLTLHQQPLSKEQPQRAVGLYKTSRPSPRDHSAQ